MQPPAACPGRPLPRANVVSAGCGGMGSEPTVLGFDFGGCEELQLTGVFLKLLANIVRENFVRELKWLQG